MKENSSTILHVLFTDDDIRIAVPWFWESAVYEFNSSESSPFDQVDSDSASSKSSHPLIHIHDTSFILWGVPHLFVWKGSVSNKVLGWVLKIKTDVYLKFNDTKVKATYSLGHKLWTLQPDAAPKTTEIH